MTAQEQEIGVYEDVYVSGHVFNTFGDAKELLRPGITMDYNANLGWDVNVWLCNTGDATRVSGAVPHVSYEQHGLVLLLQGVPSHHLRRRGAGMLAIRSYKVA